MLNPLQTILTMLLLFVVLSLISYLITSFMIHSVRIMDIPNARSSHTVKTPKSGGIALVMVFILMQLLLYMGFADAFFAFHIEQKQQLILFSITALIIALFSLLDDIQEVSVHAKFIAQIIASFVLILSGFTFNQLSLPIIGEVDLLIFSYVISFVWLIGLTNAYNFMDGLDGLIAGVTVLVCAFFMLICWQQQELLLSLLTLSLLAGAFGFLICNFPPAKIFMGDVGSAFAGFFLAAIALWATTNNMASMWLMPMLVFNIIFDTFFTYIRRYREGKKLTQAHKTHCYQLLNQLGFSHKEVSLIHYFFVFVQGMVALLMIKQNETIHCLFFIPFIAFYSFYCWRVIQQAKAKQLI